MSNMSYCRFQNTVDDLEDCLEALRELDGICRNCPKKSRTLQKG